MRPSRSIILLNIALLLSGISHSALAAKDRIPVYLEADNIAFDHKKGVSTYRGNVRLKRGMMKVLANKARVKQARNQVVSVNASGSPVIMKHRDKESTVLTVIRGDRLEFDATTNIVTVSGNVITTRGQDKLRSNRLVYQVSDGRIIAERGPGQSRVSADIQPDTAP